MGNLHIHQIDVKFSLPLVKSNWKRTASKKRLKIAGKINIPLEDFLKVLTNGI